MNSVSKRTTAAKELVRIVDRVSLTYLDRCVANRDSNAITATDEFGTVHIPSASIGALLLGPGTTITHQANNCAPRERGDNPLCCASHSSLVRRSPRTRG